MARLITNIGRLVTMDPARNREGELGVIKDAAVKVEDGKIRWFGLSGEVRLPASAKGGCASGANGSVAGDTRCEVHINARQGIVIPGLIDCHTHLVHAGDRADEFAMRARGATYEEIAKAGGGIMSTVRATRTATEDGLFELARGRANESLVHGITIIEVKSGYGLDLETELKMLRVVKRLNKDLPQEFVPTFLAHMVSDMKIPLNPPLQKGGGGGFEVDRKEYIQYIINTVLPTLASEGLVRFCDVFVEKIAFTAKEAEKIFKAAKKHGLGIKVHADQLSSCGGAALAAHMKAISADHLEHANKKDITAMAKAGVAAIMIPTSTFFIGGKYAPAREMIKQGMKVAISTDYNPGTSPILNLWMAANLAITQMKLTPEEAYRGITINAARALGLEKAYGSIKVGKVADMVILDAKSEFEPFYRFDKSFVARVIKKGRVVYER